MIIFGTFYIYLITCHLVIFIMLLIDDWFCINASLPELLS